jgi:Ca-activated chloride channel family protein
MRRTIIAVVALVVGAVATIGAAADRASAQSATWIGGSALEGRVIVGANGETWVGVWVDAPNVVGAHVAMRAPMAVSLVVDVSGSMAGDKIRNAQLAASSLIESLADGDIVSLYGFSNVVTEVAPPTRLDPSMRAVLMQRVSMLVAGGGTNLHDGMQVAVSRIAQSPPTHPIRRIFLISDGRANVGPSDPGVLGDLAASATEWGTQITAIGVGYDYDPSVLGQMAVRSAGRLHHLGRPEHMATILETELSRMSQSVALNGSVMVEPAPGVVIIGAATTGAVIEGGRLRLALGAVDAGQRREILFRVRVPTAQLGSRALATVRFEYQSPDGRAPRTQSTRLEYVVARNGAPAATAPRVAAMVVQHEASEAQRRAADLLAQGQAQQAAAQLAQARAQLDSAASRYHFADERVAGELRTRAASVGAQADRAASTTSATEAREQSFEVQAAPMAAEGY